MSSRKCGATHIGARGNGDLTYDENKSHWTAWALFKSPLLIGTNVSLTSLLSRYRTVTEACRILQLSAISTEIVDILTNPEIIAIHQDPVVGTSIAPFRWGINVRPSPCFPVSHRDPDV